MHKSKTTAYLVYTTVGFIADSIHFLLKFVHLVPTRRFASDYAPSDVDDLTDAQIYELRDAALERGDRLSGIGAHHIIRTTGGTVVKRAQDWEEEIDDPSEALTLDLVFHQTIIPVPRVRRVFRHQFDNRIVMDYIPSRQLSSVWPNMSLLEKLRVAFILRSYVRQLRTIQHQRSTVPGPLAQEGPRVCFSPLFAQVVSQRGPFASYPELSAFFNHRMSLSRNGRAASLGPFDDSSPLVLTHHDINMRNVLVGDDGRLWLIDWAWSGFYPRWFEFVATSIQSENEEVVTRRKEPLWDMMVPFICGPYFRQEKWHYYVSRALDLV